MINERKTKKIVIKKEFKEKIVIKKNLKKIFDESCHLSVENKRELISQF
jgi:hypothetical protein